MKVGRACAARTTDTGMILLGTILSMFQAAANFLTVSFEKPMVVGLKLNISALMHAVEREVAAMSDDVPNRSVRAEALELMEQSDARGSLTMLVEPMVRHALARRALIGSQKVVKKVGGMECLSHLNPLRRIGRGVDGSVYVLESGKAAKVGVLDMSHHDYLDESRILEAIGEIDAAKAAGQANISPQVHDAWFCCSATNSAYVIVMDRVDGGVDLFNWVHNKSKAQISKMHEQLDVLVRKMNRLGIFHNDLHAGNVVVDRNNRPWIIDFSRCTFVETLADRDDDAKMVRNFLEKGGRIINIPDLTTCVVASLIKSELIQVDDLDKEVPDSSSDLHVPSISSQMLNDSTNAPSALNTKTKATRRKSPKPPKSSPS